MVRVILFVLGDTLEAIPNAFVTSRYLPYYDSLEQSSKYCYQIRELHQQPDNIECNHERKYHINDACSSDPNLLAQYLLSTVPHFIVYNSAILQ